MAGSENNIGQEKARQLTRREFLLLFKVGAALTAAKFVFDLHKQMFGDTAMLLRCTGAERGEADYLWQTELAKSYDEALLVIHPGFGLLRNPKKYKDEPKYGEYINNLKLAIENSREKGDLVIFLVGAEEVRGGKFVEGLSYKESDVAIATNSGNPAPIACAETPDHEFVFQKILTGADVSNLLKEKLVKRVKLAGEFRGACVDMAKNFMEEGVFERVELLDEALYPPQD